MQFSTAAALAPLMLVKDLNPGTASSLPGEFTSVGDKMFFDAEPDGNHTGLYVSDGTADGTVLLHTFDLAGIGYRGATGGDLFFEGDSHLWRSDGTSDGTVMLSSENPLEFASFNGVQYFGTVDEQLWKTDGTPEGTVKVAPMVGGLLVAADGVIYFDGNDGGKEALGKTDGTAAGTVVVATVPDGEQMRTIFPVGKGAYFTTEQIGVSQGDEELWWSDGTADGTKLLRTWQPPSTIAEDRGPNNLVLLNGELYFRVVDGATETDGLWKSDGTAAGTVPVYTEPVNFHAFILNMTVSGGELYFRGGDSGSYPFDYPLMWKSDGTSDGTQLLAPDLGIVRAGKPLVAYGYVFFSGAEGDTASLFRTDGTTEGTVPVGEAGNSVGAVLGAANGYVLSTGDDPDHGIELWSVQIEAQTGEFSGSVFNDTNHNGLRDSGEAGLPGVTVYLDMKQDGKEDAGDPTAISDANGNYTFTGLSGGSYIVRQILPDGYAETAPKGYAGSAVVSGNATADGPVFGDVAVSTVRLDFSYLLALAQHYNGPGTFADGDLNRDGKVDFSDLLVLAQHYDGTLVPTIAARHTRLRATGLLGER